MCFLIVFCSGLQETESVTGSIPSVIGSLSKLHTMLVFLRNIIVIHSNFKLEKFVKTQFLEKFQCNYLI